MLKMHPDLQGRPGPPGLVGADGRSGPPGIPVSILATYKHQKLDFRF